MVTRKRKDREIIRDLLIKSRIESDGLKERDLRCPNCDFKIDTVFSDACGHIRVKCPKCKHIYILNVAYFRTMKQNKRFFNLNK